MSRKLLLIPLTLLLLASCETAQPSAASRVPLEPWPKEDQQRAGALIEQRCGPNAICPKDAVLENAALMLTRLRAMVRAAGLAQ
jgi:nitrous oxide reductase accessory protein NosL